MFFSTKYTTVSKSPLISDGTLGNNTIKAHYFKQLLITPWGFSPIPLDAAFKMVSTYIILWFIDCFDFIDNTTVKIHTNI